MHDRFCTASVYNLHDGYQTSLPCTNFNNFFISFLQEYHTDRTYKDHFTPRLHLPSRIHIETITGPKASSLPSRFREMHMVSYRDNGITFINKWGHLSPGGYLWHNHTIVTPTQHHLRVFLVKLEVLFNLTFNTILTVLQFLALAFLFSHVLLILHPMQQVSLDRFTTETLFQSSRQVLHAMHQVLFTPIVIHCFSEHRLGGLW